MPFPSRLRSACDRCHSQKLKCTKPTETAICARCMRAGAQCAYSPAGTTYATTIVDDLVMGNDGTPAAYAFAQEPGWTLPDDVDFNSILPAFASPAAQFNLNDGSNETASNYDIHIDAVPEAATSSKNPNDKSTTRQLADLLQDSDSLWARLSMDSTLHVAPHEAHDAFLNTLSAKSTERDILENFFVLVQRLIDVYPAAISASLTPVAPTKDANLETLCDLQDCTHMVDVSPDLQELEKAIRQQSILSGLDSTLSTLLFACHGRQLDILDRVFQLVVSCTRATLATRREPDFDVSEMRVGSFVAQRTAAVLMQVALLKHLLRILTTRLLSLGDAVSAWMEDCDSISPEGNILKLQHELIMRRHAMKISQVGVVEEFLTNFDLSGN